jgi:hypothetical protein
MLLLAKHFYGCFSASIQTFVPVLIKGTASREFFASGFFIYQFPLQPQTIPVGPFRIFFKIRGDILKSRCTTGTNNIGGKLATSFPSFVDTSGK